MPNLFLTSLETSIRALPAGYDISQEWGNWLLELGRTFKGKALEDWYDLLDELTLILKEKFENHGTIDNLVNTAKKSLGRDLLLPRSGVTAIDELSTEILASPKIFRKWWDERIDELLNAFNTFENFLYPRYDHWTAYRDMFVKKVLDLHPNYSKEINDLALLTKNQLGCREVDECLDDHLKEFSARKTVHKLNEFYEKVNQKTPRALEMISAKWRYNANFGLVKNLTNYLNEKRFIESYRLNQSVEACMTRALDGLKTFMGSNEETKTIIPLNEEMDIEFKELAKKIPEMFMEYKRKFYKGDPIEFEMKLRQDPLDILEPSEEFLAWWRNCSFELDRYLYAMSYSLLDRILPPNIQNITVANRVRYEDLFLCTFDSFLTMEVFSADEMYKLWGMENAEDPSVITYLTCITRRLRESVFGKKAFVRMIINYSSEKISDSEGLKALEELKDKILSLCVNSEMMRKVNFRRELFRIIKESPVFSENRRKRDFLVACNKAVMGEEGHEFSAQIRAVIEDMIKTDILSIEDDFFRVIKNILEKICCKIDESYLNELQFLLNKEKFLIYFEYVEEVIPKIIESVRRIFGSRSRAKHFAYEIARLKVPFGLKREIIKELSVMYDDESYIEASVVENFVPNELSMSLEKVIFDLYSTHRNEIPYSEYDIYGIGLKVFFGKWQSDPLNYQIFRDLLKHRHMPSELQRSIISYTSKILKEHPSQSKEKNLFLTFLENKLKEVSLVPQSENINSVPLSTDYLIENLLFAIHVLAHRKKTVIKIIEPKIPLLLEKRCLLNDEAVENIRFLEEYLVKLSKPSIKKVTDHKEFSKAVERLSDYLSEIDNHELLPQTTTAPQPSPSLSSVFSTPI